MRKTFKELQSITPLSRYELPLVTDTARSSEIPAGADETTRHFPAGLIFRNALWFCQLRWGAVALSLIPGLVGLFDIARPLGYRPHSGWSFVIAFALAGLNLIYLLLLSRSSRINRLEDAETILPVQIILDLALLTAMVHFLGSIETYAPFLYLAHIVLTCIFFTRRQAFFITILAFSLYLGCIFLETFAFIGSKGVYTDPSFRAGFGTLQLVTNISFLLGIFLAVWHLASHLSGIIYARDRELARTNERLLRTQSEKAQHMLRTTHELKAPFAAIHANAQLLINGYCGRIPDEALAVIRRIAERARRLSADIQAMLQLANLSTIEKQTLHWSRLDLSDLLQRCIDQVQSQAKEREVEIGQQLLPVVLEGVEDHLSMLLLNLVSNAVNYSQRGGKVWIECAPGPSGHARVIVEDQGIGIAPGKIHRIFEEHYRTEEAASHNKESSGLGLAIVKSVADTHHIRVCVESTPGELTRFTCHIPLEAAHTASRQADGKIRELKRLLCGQAENVETRRI